jgi:hypothetical protein
LVENKLLEFGSSKELIKSAAHALKGNTDPPNHLRESIEAAYQVANCGYEYNSGWGTKVSNNKYGNPELRAHIKSLFEIAFEK